MTLSPAWFSFSSFSSAATASACEANSLAAEANLSAASRHAFNWGRGLELECRLLQLELLAVTFDVFFDLRLEGAPVGFQSCLDAGPCGLVGSRLLLDGVAEVIAIFAQLSQNLAGLVLGIDLHLGGLAFKRRQRGVHFIEPLLGPICKEVNAVLSAHFFTPGILGCARREQALPSHKD